MSESNDTVIVGSFDAVMNMPSERGGQITMHGYLYAGDTPEEINRRLDMNADALKRQFERAGIEMREAHRAQQVAILEQTRSLYGGLVEKKDRGQKFTSVEKQQFDSAPMSIKNALEAIEKMDKDIADAKRKVGMT